MTQAQLERFFKALDRCAEKHAGCDNCSKRVHCINVTDHLPVWPGNRRHGKRALWPDHEGIPDSNPCVTQTILMPRGFQIKPLTMADVKAIVSSNRWEGV